MTTRALLSRDTKDPKDIRDSRVHLVLCVLGVLSVLLSSAAAAPPSTPLAAPAGKSEGKLFLERPAAETGIDFVHRWDPPAAFASAIDTEAAGGGVAIGDCDGDGLPDLLLTRPAGGVQLYRNLGGFRFENATEKSGLGADKAWTTGASFADVDNDGDLDLYLCGFGCANRLHRNDGKGHFTEMAAACGVAFNGASVMASFADFDNDGDLDFYIVTIRTLAAPGDPKTEGDLRSSITRDERGEPVLPEEWREKWGLLKKSATSYEPVKTGQVDHLYRNDGPGADGASKFTDITTAAGVSDYAQGLSATWWDYDGDGWQDLYVSNDFWGADRLWHNQRDGTFKDMAPALLPHTPWFSMGTDAADINNDGLLDFMASDMAGSDHYKDKMGMGDMESKGWFLELPVPRQYMRNAVYLNSGAGPFMECAHLLRVAGTDWTWSVKFADLDCDGWQDLFVTNGMTGDFLNSDLVAAAIASGRKIEQAPPKRDRDMAFRNAGGLTFESTSQSWGVDREAVSFGAGCGDLDGDGDLDLVVNQFDEAPAVYQNTGTGTQRVSFRLRGVKSNYWGLGARVTQEAGGTTQTRELSLAHGFATQDEPLLHFGLGKAEKIDRLTVRWPSGAVESFTSLKAGRRYTITEPDTAPPAAEAKVAPLFRPSPFLESAAHVEAAFDDFARQPLLPNRLSTQGPASAWADVDGDGDDDFFLGRAAGTGGMIYFNEGRDDDGRIKLGAKSLAPFDKDAACEDMGVLFFDADGDGDQDLYIVSGGVECEPGAAVLQDRLYRNDGKGTFTRDAAALPAETDSGSCVVPADFDNDGDLDLFVGGRSIPGKYPLAAASHLLRNDGGKFTDITPAAFTKAGMITAAVAVDADGDSWVDLLCAVEWGPVRYFKNTKGTLAETSFTALTGWWNSLTAADLDADGDMDFIAGNFGLNTKYHPTPEKPANLFYGDFDGSGTPQVVEAKTMPDHTLLPMRGKSCSQNAMPFLREKFPTFHKFASASLNDIYSDAKLSSAVHLTATTLDTGIFWNDGARFTFAPLPRLAQLAPVFCIAVLDANADGHLDLVLAQNFHGPQRETGHMDGGLSVLLTGDGTRHFTALWPDNSGLTLNADARSLTIADVNHDQRPDLIFAINNAGMRTFENHSPALPSSFVPPASLQPGQLLRVTTSTGRKLTTAWLPGSGCLSQSAPRFLLPLRAGESATAVK